MAGEVLTNTSLVSLGATAFIALFSYILSRFLGKKTSCVDRWILFWLIFDAIIHFTLEGSFVVLSLLGTVEKSDHFTAELWKEYAKADKRWGVSDPTIVSLEILTVVFDGLLCLVLIYAIIKDKFYRHYVQIVLCVCEIYGGWMTFAPEWLTGSPNLVTSNALYLWVYLFFFNMLWVVVPLALLYQSWGAMRDAFPESNSHANKKKAGDDSKNTTRRYNLRSKKAD